MSVRQYLQKGILWEDDMEQGIRSQESGVRRQKGNGETGKGRNGEKTSPILRFSGSPIRLHLILFCILLFTGCAAKELAFKRGICGRICKALPDGQQRERETEGKGNGSG